MEDLFAVPVLAGLVLWGWYWRSWVKASTVQGIGRFSQHITGALLGFFVYLFMLMAFSSLMLLNDPLEGVDWFVSGVFALAALVLVGLLGQRIGRSQPGCFAVTEEFEQGEKISKNHNIVNENTRLGKRSQVSDQKVSLSTLDEGLNRSHFGMKRFNPQKIAFLYEDAEGNMSSRVVEVDATDGFRFEGICLDRSARRTFRLDRVIGDIRFTTSRTKVYPEDLMNALGVSADVQPPQAPRNPPKSAVDVLFTGFDKDEREFLEEDARDAGMRVRKTVTQNLGVLVAGPRCGPRKRSEAEARGAIIVDENGFYQLIDTGEF